MRDDRNRNEIHSETFEQDSLYWRKFVQEASGYVRFYRTGEGKTRTRSLSVDQDAVSAFLVQRGRTRLELFGSVFALYLSRIHRLGGCLLRTSVPAGWRTMIRVDVDSRSRFSDLTGIFRSALAEAAAHTRMDIDGYLREKATWYAVYDAPDGNEDDAVLALLSGPGRLSLRYHPDVFSEAYMDHMVKNLESVLDTVLRDPDQILGEMELLSEEEQSLLSAFSAGKAVPVEEDRTLSASFREYAKAHPDAIAVDDGANRISYGELEKSSNAVACDLSTRHHLGRGSRAGLMLPRNYHYLELILAINKIGAAYIPLDPLFPAIRVGHMLRIARADCLITTKEIGETLQVDGKVLYLEDLDRDHGVEVDILGDKDDPFTILFTSGTTGVPKGVLFHNGALPWACASFMEIFRFSPGDVVGSFLSFSFVASLFLNATLYLGGTVRLFNEREQKDPLLLLKALKETHMNSLILPPAVGVPLYEREDLNLDYLILAGAKLNELHKKARHTKLVNFYGATEVVFAISKIYDVRDIPEDKAPPVGKPVPNTRTYVLDAENHRMPVGVPGEICIASSFRAEGYLDDPELTAARFVPNPFSDSEKTAVMYRTGDIGFYNFDGDIEIIGREDSQLSVRGFRIESGEILSILKRFSGMGEVYLDVENDNLIAYYTAGDDLKLDQVQEALKNELPYYMIPSLFIRLEEIPLNINGKIDRARLKTAEKRRQVEIADDILRGVVDAWKEVLELEDVSVDDHFAALGGNSLSAMKLLLVLKDKLDVSLSASELIGLSTPKEIAGYIKYHVRTAWDENRYDFDHPCPLSESQLNVYLDEGLHQRWDAYHNPFMLRFRDRRRVTPEKLRAALEGLFRAFPVLKARVILQEGVPAFLFDAEPEIAEGTASDIASFVRPFETDQSLSRYLIAEDGETLALCMDFHHLIFDGSSLNVLLRALFALLGGEAVDFVDTGVLRETAFEEEILPSVLEEGRAFFDRMLADQEEAYELPASVETGYGADADTDRAREYLCEFDVDTDRLGDFLRRCNLTENQFFAGVFAYTLSRFTGSEKVLFSLAEDGRGHIDLSGSVGMFVKTLPVLMDCRDQETVSFLRYASGVINNVMKHDLVPFRLLARDYDVNAGVIFQYAHTMLDDALRQAGDCDIEELPHPQNADLSFTIFNHGREGLVLRALHSARYDDAFIKRFTESYRMILEGMLRAERLSDLRYTSDSDLEALDRYNQTEAPIRYQDILEAFNDRLREAPENRLVECGDVCYSFAEGACIADRIRRKLEESGVRPGDRVSFLVPRSELYLFCTLGIMAVGAAYVPLDDTLPDERLAFMIGDTGSRMLIVADGTLERAGELLAKNPQGTEARDVTLLNLSDLMREPTGRAERLPFEAGEIACILYTSGSTGMPKGVRITRKSLANFTDFVVRDLTLQPGDVCALFASIGFDVSMEAMFTVVYSGACLNVIPNEIKFNIQAMNRYFMKHHVTCAHFSAQVARMFISQVEETSLRVLLTGGEKLGQIHETRKYRMEDTYGPTEACVSVLCVDVDQKIDPGSIGFPMTNTKAYVLDRERRRTPIGAVGGLYLSGPQLAAGYLNREAETAAAFLPNPFETNPEYARLYATGDVARILPDGSYGFIGRRDGQVKIRGNRVELSEVEAMIRQMEIVRDVTAQVKQADGNNELVVYVVSDETDDLTLRNAITDFLSARAPAYMVPSFVVRINRIPLNVNGKVDKRALPEVDFNRLHAADYTAPRTEMEERIVRGFERVLQRENIGVHDDFIRLGGDSLTAVKLLSFLGQCNVTVADILSQRTPEAIAAGASKEVLPDQDLYTLETGCPLNNAQMFIYLDIVKNHKSDSYLVPSLIPIPKKYGMEQIMNALDRVLAAYPVLSTRVEVRDGVPYLAPGARPEVMKGSLNLISVFGYLAADFDIQTSLSRFIIINLPGKCYLVSVFHHLIFDVVSNNVFTRAFQRALEGDPLDDVDDAFLKLSAFQQRMRDTEEYNGIAQFAQSMLSGVKHAGYYLNDSGKQGKSGFLTRKLDVDVEGMKRFLEKYGTTRNIFFTAVMACTLSRLSGQEDVAFGFIDNGRDRFNSFDAIGLYLNGLPLLAHVDQQNMKAFLEKLSDTYYKLVKYNYYPFTPMTHQFIAGPVILFQFLPDWITEDDNYYSIPLPDAVVNKIISRMGNFEMEALIDLVEKGDRYMIRIIYSGYYSRKHVEILAETYEATLSQLIHA